MVNMAQNKQAQDHSFDQNFSCKPSNSAPKTGLDHNLGKDQEDFGQSNGDNSTNVKNCRDAKRTRQLTGGKPQQTTQIKSAEYCYEANHFRGRGQRGTFGCNAFAPTANDGLTNKSDIAIEMRKIKTITLRNGLVVSVFVYPLRLSRSVMLSITRPGTALQTAVTGLYSYTSENEVIHAKCKRHKECDTEKAHSDLTKLIDYLHSNDKSNNGDKENSEFGWKFKIFWWCPGETAQNKSWKTAISTSMVAINSIDRLHFPLKFPKRPEAL